MNEEELIDNLHKKTTKDLRILILTITAIYRQSPVKNQPIKHKVENFLCFNKSSPQHERNLNKSKSSQFIPKENEVAMQHSLIMIMQIN